ncbi:Mus81 protein [Saccharomycopsis crataegensis]|uniref:Crossover junction endonuclease MUS81 n=1 Tax=Saccharomycopsis crataegensis TaxID=43959 RepID=A0AAV5QKV0_9ASCO|nr:Mus81 protein [Saccharomycopsis crataegensis]
MMELYSSDLKHLFVTWMEKAAIDAANKNSRSAIGINHALDKLKKHKSPLTNRKDLASIPYFGEKRVDFLLDKLKQYCSVEGYTFPASFKALQTTNTRTTAVAANTSFHSSQDSPARLTKSSSSSSTAAKAKGKKKYVPAKRSGGYAILIVLFKYDKERRGLTKDEIVQQAAPYCDRSFTSNPATKQFYSAWNSSKTLINQGLILGSGRPMHYYLTDEGSSLAKLLFRSEGGGANNNNNNNNNDDDDDDMDNSDDSIDIDDILPTANKRSLGELYQKDKEEMSIHKRHTKTRNDVQRTNPAPETSAPHSIWKAGTFEVMMVLDTREIRSKNERNFFFEKLNSLGIKSETEPLAVGDSLWVAKHKETKERVVLDFILERKRLDDLAESITDGRFFEQKSRLAKTGMRNIYYLVEEQTSSDLAKFSESIKTAICLTIVGSKFYLKRSRDSDQTTAFFYNLTKTIEEYYATKDLMVVKSRSLNTQSDYKSTLEKYREKHQSLEPCLTFEAFQTTLNKSSLMTVKEVFVKMLMTIKGVSLEKALVIQKHFVTPKKLIDTYNSMLDVDELAKKMLIRDRTIHEVGAKSVGPKVSEKIYENWGRLSY